MPGDLLDVRVEKNRRKAADNSPVARQSSSPDLYDRNRIGNKVRGLVEEAVPQPRAEYPQDHDVVREDNDQGLVKPGLTHLPLPEVISYQQHAGENDAIIAHLQRPEGQYRRINVPSESFHLVLLISAARAAIPWHDNC